MMVNAGKFYVANVNVTFKCATTLTAQVTQPNDKFVSTISVHVTPDGRRACVSGGFNWFASGAAHRHNPNRDNSLENPKPFCQYHTAIHMAIALRDMDRHQRSVADVLGPVVPGSVSASVEKCIAVGDDAQKARRHCNIAVAKLQSEPISNIAAHIALIFGSTNVEFGTCDVNGGGAGAGAGGHLAKFIPHGPDTSNLAPHIVVHRPEFNQPRWFRRPARGLTPLEMATFKMNSQDQCEHFARKVANQWPPGTFATPPFRYYKVFSGPTRSGRLLIENTAAFWRFLMPALAKAWVYTRAIPIATQFRQQQGDLVHELLAVAEAGPAIGSGIGAFLRLLTVDDSGPQRMMETLTWHKFFAKQHDIGLRYPCLVGSGGVDPRRGDTTPKQSLSYCPHETPEEAQAQCKCVATSMFGASLEPQDVMIQNLKASSADMGAIARQLDHGTLSAETAKSVKQAAPGCLRGKLLGKDTERKQWAVFLEKFRRMVRALSQAPAVPAHPSKKRPARTLPDPFPRTTRQKCA